MSDTTTRQACNAIPTQSDLSEALKAGTLTDQQLIAAINHNGNSFESIQGSIGLSWLHTLFQRAERARRMNRENVQDNPDVIAVKTLRTRVLDMASVFRACLHNHHIAVVLSITELLELVDEPDRAAFMHDVLAHQEPYNSCWVNACIKAGITQDEIAEAILGLLRRSTKPDQGRRSFLVNDFLENGGGMVGPTSDRSGWEFLEQNTPWSVLSDNQLIAAMRLCIDKTPETFFGPRPVNSTLTFAESLAIRLSAEQLQTLLAEAADKLTSLAGISVGVFSRLALQQQRMLIEELPGCGIELLVHTATRLPDHFTFFKGQAPKVCDEASTALSGQFCKLQPQLEVLRKQSDTLRRFADHVDRTLVKQLELQGYVVGTLIEEMHKGRRQLCVRLGDHTYVEQRGSSFSSERYFPERGDRVVFMPSNGRKLVPGRVTAVVFRLVSRPATNRRM